MGIQTLNGLLGHPVVGASWEGFVIENILSVAPPGTDAYFYRTAAGAEIDLLLSIHDQLWAIEIKYSTVPKLTKGFFIACDDINPTSKWVIYTGTEDYTTKDEVRIISLASFLKQIARTV